MHRITKEAEFEEDPAECGEPDPSKAYKEKGSELSRPMRDDGGSVNSAEPSDRDRPCSAVRGGTREELIADSALACTRMSKDLSVYTG